MHELVFLKSLIIILGISACVVFILHRMRISSIVGFLLAGMLLGPYGLQFVEDIGTIQILAEIGVVLLLFTIGLEFSLSRFLRMRLEVFGIGSLQVLTAGALSSFIAYQKIGDINTSIFIGFLVALSSTAIVLKLLSERAELDSPHGRISIGVLIFQDLCIVPFMLFIPVLSGGGQIGDLAVTSLKAGVIIALVMLSARWVVPALLHQIIHTRNRELFVITVLIICFGTALITSEFGLSLALGAFLAGLVISESEYSHEAISTILPLRDSFNGLFFISVGMLMDMSFFAGNITLILLVVLGLVALKLISSFVPMYLFRRSVRASIQASINLAQIGEFSFVLAVAGLSAGLITNEIYQVFLSASILTMLLTPAMVNLSPSLSDRITSHPMLKRIEWKDELPDDMISSQKKTGHIIVVGFGLNGRNLTRVLKEVNIPYVVLELNNSTVRDMRKHGEPIYYGDGTKADVLGMLGVKTASILVVAISDPASCRNIVKTARQENPDIFIIARTRYAAEVDDLLKLGADEVIPEEFETSVEIFSRVLDRYQIPKNEIFNYVDMIREDGYRALRQPVSASRKPLFDRCTVLSKVDVELFAMRENLSTVGRSLGELQLRKKTGATVVAVERNGEMHSSPVPEFVFSAGDIVFITGNREAINRAVAYLEKGDG
ncbi:MAG: potassium transporter KefB [Nitrospiraceae bacterium]|nr:MAG: potassium transporter KefB [Nitrospiraceae bacterium]